MMAFRLHESPVNHPIAAPYGVHALGDRFEVHPGGELPPLRLFLHGHEKAFTVIPQLLSSLVYDLEQHRGYECCGDLWSPGYFRLMLTPDTPGTLVASTESWETIGALSSAGSAARRAPPAHAARRSGPSRAADRNGGGAGAGRRSVHHHAGRPRRGGGARQRHGRRGADRDRRLPLVHGLGPRHDDQPRRARRSALDGSARPATSCARSGITSATA